MNNLKHVTVRCLQAFFEFWSPTLRLRFLNLLRLALEGLPGSPSLVVSTRSVIHTPRGSIRFYGLGALPTWRAETLLTKEPETIEWLESMAPGEVLYDIGANIGVYTLYAAIKGRNPVLAFEPLASNYYLLNRNIEENGLSKTVRAYCLAINDDDCVDRFHAQDTDFGSALSSFGVHIDQHGQSNASNFEQAMVGVRLDSFIDDYGPPFPTHIKIDVDGLEDKVIAGAAKTLIDPRLKSISIELDESQDAYVSHVQTSIEQSGLSLVGKRRSSMFDGTPSARTYNYHFSR